MNEIDLDNDLNSDNELNSDIIFNLEFRIQNKNLIQQLEEVSNLYNEIILYINDNCIYNYHTIDLINLYKKSLNDVNLQIELFKKIHNNNDDIIYDKCNHNFITDTIDITLDNTCDICYCTICELTKRV